MYTNALDNLDPTGKVRVCLHNHQACLGDRLAMTSLVRDLHETYPNWRIKVDVLNDMVWRNNPHLCEYPESADLFVNLGPARATQSSRTNGVHFIRAFREGWLWRTGIPVRPGPFKADLHLNERELRFRPVPGAYWVINCDCGPFGSKRWVPERWRELVRAMPSTTFVQVGLKQDNEIDLGDEPNVVSLVGWTDDRQLFALVRHATGCIGLVSSLIHVAAAFDKPAVCLAGGREPASFEHYPGQRYLERIGALQCCRTTCCWKNSLEACLDKPRGVARCMELIEVPEVVAAVESYYAGGRLPRLTCVDACPPRLRMLRIVTNGAILGGAERSVCQIAQMFHERGWLVEIATRGGRLCPAMAERMPFARPTQRISAPCDVLLLYASDMVYDFHKPEFAPFAELQAKRRVMALTYKLGKAATDAASWTRNWDQYLFLSSALRDAFIERTGEVDDLPRDMAVPVDVKVASLEQLKHPSLIITHQCEVLPPPVDLGPFLSLARDYTPPVHVVRHSSQGDRKYPPGLERIPIACPGVQFSFMPAPSWLPELPNVARFAENEISVTEFLARGNLYWYLLPEGYTDQGPRAIIEAMAAGLAVICERRDGAADRVTAETGWFMGSEQAAIELLQNVDPSLLAAKGRAARQRARSEFDRWRWYDVISGDSPESSSREPVAAAAATGV